MPLSGRKGTGANVWVQNGALWIYLAHNGAYDEEGRLLKLGCIRIVPINIYLGANGFKQELDLATGAINISQPGLKISLWFAGETLIYEFNADKPLAVNVAYANWRDKPRDSVRLDMFRFAKLTADSIKPDNKCVFWFHRNSDAGIDILKIAKQQGIPSEAVHDITSKRVFGGAMALNTAVGLPVVDYVQWQNWKGKAWIFTTSESKQHIMTVHLAGGLNEDPKKWVQQAKTLLSPVVRKQVKRDELERWKQFWSRSHVNININKPTNDTAFIIGRNYQLFRYMLACNRDGELPLLFNGGIFTVDNMPGRISGNNNDELPIYQEGETTPDFRRWMFCSFMSQNQRWLGWPAIANGDIDLLSPSLSFYRDREITAAARAKTNGAIGVVYPEPLDVWGLCSSGVAPRPDGLTNAQHLTYHFSMMLEHAWMALQAHDQLGIFIKKDLQWIKGTILFYDSYYRKQHKSRTGKELNDSGKLVIYPACGLELAVGATNPIEVVSGLTRITAALIALPEINSETRKTLQRIQSSLPALPTGIRDGKESLLPAVTWEKEYNVWEPIEMYAYWPYRMVGITKPSTISLARNTWLTIPAARAKFCKQDYSWMANVINMAALGWTDSAKQRVIYKMSNLSAPQARFPAFLVRDTIGYLITTGVVQELLVYKRCLWLQILMVMEKFTYYPPGQKSGMLILNYMLHSKLLLKQLCVMEKFFH
ncbi:MAG: hypothetical protein H7320_18480 [Ferruginibacter sp.]|nr:hypothetical protein [Ferruginibacter sp.]